MRSVLRCRLTTKIFPTYVSWLNRLERCVALLTDNKLRRGTCRSIQALDKDIREWISAWNENPKLFTRTKTASSACRVRCYAALGTSSLASTSS